MFDTSSEQIRAARPMLEAAFSRWLDQLCNEPGACRDHLRGLGAVGRFEEKLRRLYGKRHCLLVSSATTGLLSSAWCFGIVNSEVVVPPTSYGATYATLEFLENNLVFAEADLDGNMAPSSVERLLTPQTKAVVASDWNGRPHDMFSLRTICNRSGVIYLADASQSYGNTRNGLPASSLADALILSFGPGKGLFCGEGGAILTSDDNLYERLVATIQHPERYGREFNLDLQTDMQFLNGRIHPVAAIMGDVLTDGMAGGSV